MVSIILNCNADDRDALIAELHELGTTGIVEEAASVEAYFDSADESCHVAARFADRSPRVVEHGVRDYVAEFQESWQAAELGDRLWLAPPWDESETPPGRIRVDYQPGMACGSGAHPCTQLCLEILDRRVQPGDRVLDIGAGSGILLNAARSLGASLIAGCDIDHEAAVIGAGNVPWARMWTGSARSVRSGSFDIVIANISAPAAAMLHADLCRIARRLVVLSGFRVIEIPGELAGLARMEREGWVCVTDSRVDR